MKRYADFFSAIQIAIDETMQQFLANGRTIKASKLDKAIAQKITFLIIYI